MQHRRVLIFFTPNTDSEQKRALSVVCAFKLCICVLKKKEEKSMILFLLFTLPLLWSHLRFRQQPHACSYWLQPFYIIATGY